MKQFSRATVANGLAGSLLLLAGACGVANTPAASPNLNDWAYPFIPPAKALAADATTSLNVTGSTRHYTQAQTRDPLHAVDWFPDEHSAMPRPVATGRAPGAMACGFCHLPTGNGRPENAPLAGLQADYIVAQVKAFRDGSRRSAGSNMFMVHEAQAVTDEEAAEAATYFAGLKHQSFLRVVETDTIPRVEIRGLVWAKASGDSTEKLGDRLIEIADDWQRFERRDPHVTYTVFVPPGSIARGAKLAASWGEGGSKACSVCHGDDLRGGPLAPPIAGRSPSYLIRQLNDIKTAHRLDPGVSPMQQVARDMTPDDMIALASFVASRKP